MFLIIPNVVVLVVSIVTGKSLVSMILVDAMDELKNLEVNLLWISDSWTVAILFFEMEIIVTLLLLSLLPVSWCTSGLVDLGFEVIGIRLVGNFSDIGPSKKNNKYKALIFVKIHMGKYNNNKW